MTGGQDLKALAYERIARSGGAPVVLPTIVPARMIQEVSGEGLRARLCIFNNGRGEEFCLRPEMTTTISRMVADGDLAPARYVYSGPVFRLPAPGASDPIEFEQTGFEWFGGGSVEEDAEATALALEAVEAGGVSDGELVVGDVGLYNAVVDALPFSPVWADRLKRSFARARGPSALLETASAGDDAAERSVLAETLAGMDPDEAETALQEIMDLAGVQPVGGRTAAEIADRLKARASAQAPDEEAGRRLSAFLELSAPADKAEKVLSAFAKDAGVKIDKAIADFSARLGKLSKAAPPMWSGATYSASAGRRFEYYDGFVFELKRASAPDQPIAAGGRYDGLVRRLSEGRSEIAAIGAAIRMDRLSDRGAGQ
ncbi:MAG: ATP phosphoribosyltransferase regulatory subunit [Hyphomonadaceae bacterium]